MILLENGGSQKIYQNATKTEHIKTEKNSRIRKVRQSGGNYAAAARQKDRRKKGCSYNRWNRSEQLQRTTTTGDLLFFQRRRRRTR